MEQQIDWNKIGKAKKSLNTALEKTDLSEFEIKELVLIKKGSSAVTMECKVVYRPDGTIEIVC